jgi:hypothetical protein
MNNENNDANIIKIVLNSLHMPDDVKSYNLKFTEDSTGVSAVWINLKVANNSTPSDSKIRKLAQLKRQITSALFEKGIVNWPYVRYVSH